MENETVLTDQRKTEQEPLSPAESEEEYEEFEEVEYTGPSGFSLALNRWFHHLDRGGSLGGEILAGLTMFFLSICVIFMNVQVVGNVINADVTLNTSPVNPTNIAAASVYTQLYVGSILMAILGSLLMGIVARLPFTQLSTMGLASSLLCLVGTQSGLTWQNLLFINLLAGLLYAVVCGVPKLRSMVFDAVPGPVRKAFPAALGLMIAWYALQMTGLVTVNRISLGTSQFLALPGGFAFSGMRELALCGVIGAAAAAALYVLLSALKRKHRVFWPLMGGTVVFVLASILMNGLDTARTESFLNFGRIWLIAGSQASQQTPFADSYLTYSLDSLKAVFANFGQVFTVGMDFSGYTGSTFALVAGGVLSYLFAGLFQAQGTLLAAQDGLNGQAEDAGRVDFSGEPGMRKALLCNAAVNVAAPFFGVAGVGLGGCSLAAVKDHGKSGLASITACIGFVISLFVMAFPALFATVTYPVASMNEWNYFAYGNGGIVYLIQGAVFTVVDVVMICVGLSMAATLKKLDWNCPGEWLTGLATVIAAVLLSNLVVGALCGCVVCLVWKLIRDRKAIRIPTVLLTVLMAAVMVLL